jgi:hypothetical protein
MTLSAFYISFFVIGSVSIACSCTVVTLILNQLESIYEFRHLSASTRLIFYLHFTLILHDIASLPYIFKESIITCQAMGFLHVFSGDANALVMGLLAIVYRCFIVEDSTTIKIMDKINNYCEYVIFIPPMVFALLPFSTNSFGSPSDDPDNDDYPFCTILGRQWNLSVNYGVVWSILFPSLVCVCYTIAQAYRSDPDVGNKLLTRIGFYYMIALCSWIPRTVCTLIQLFGNKSASSYAPTHMTFYMGGILYFLVFTSERTALLQFENFFKSINYPTSSDVTSSIASRFNEDDSNDIVEVLESTNSIILKISADQGEECFERMP